MKCIAKIPMYFSGAMRDESCSAAGYNLPKFWAVSIDGNLDAYVCAHHARLWLIAEPSERSYLTERINARKKELHSQTKEK